MALQPGPSEPKAPIIILQARCVVLNSGFASQFRDLHMLYDKGKQEQPRISQEVEDTHEKKEKQLAAFLKTNQESAQCEETISSAFADFLME